MPSPMIYQHLATSALLEHAAQYHRETEIVSVSTAGEIERSSWGEVARNAPTAGLGAGDVGPARWRPLRYVSVE